MLINCTGRTIKGGETIELPCNMGKAIFLSSTLYGIYEIDGQLTVKECAHFDRMRWNTSAPSLAGSDVANVTKGADRRN